MLDLKDKGEGHTWDARTHTFERLLVRHEGNIEVGRGNS